VVIENQSKNVLILGGGISGCTAAQKLAAAGFDVHLVERANRIGGHAAAMGCKATDVCLRCNVCVADEVFRNINNYSNIKIYTDTELEKLEQGANGSLYTAVLHHKKGDSRSEIKVDNIIAATGHDSYNASIDAAWGYGRGDNIIDGAEAEKQLAEHNKLTRPSDGQMPKRLAFIQCVGSRSDQTHRRAEQNDYCSAVCCSYALRIAQLAKYLKQDCDVTIFYMDIQNFGRAFNKFYNQCRGSMNFIRSRPYEVNQNADGTVTVTYTPESANSNNDSQVLKADFDMVVLSVGIRPRADSVMVSDVLGISADEYGFFGLKESSPLADLQKQGIYTVGTCEWPKDIKDCIAQAQAVSTAILSRYRNNRYQPAAAVNCSEGIETKKFVINQDVLVLGGDDAMIEAAAGLSELGHRVNIRSYKALKAVEGELGDFKVRFGSNGKSEIINIGAIVLASDVKDKDSVLKKLLNNTRGIPNRIAIVLDLLAQQDKTACSEAMSAAKILVRKYGTQVKLYCSHIRTAAYGLEKLYKETRAAGVVIVKYDKPPVISDSGYNKTITVEDGVGGCELTEEFDLVVIADAAGKNICEILTKFKHLKAGPEDTIGVDNVWTLPAASNIKGIYVIGSAKGSSYIRDAQIEGLAAAYEIHQLLKNEEIEVPLDAAAVDAEKCVLCLTCLRSCPHGAISIDKENEAVKISQISCRRCGICVVQCPAGAIELPGYKAEKTVLPMEQKPKITIFACENSAYPLVETIGNFDANTKLIKVPCAGKVDPKDILRQLQDGAEKVKIFACHKENCKYLNGSSYAAKRTAYIKNMLEKAGLDSGRVSFFELASVEPAKFLEFVKE